MKVQAIIHQQICQLRWHILACLGLIMVLPLEEATVSLRAGDGFYSVNLAVGAVMMAPLLAGLIACANVQGDLGEKHYIFWRSKPANVKGLMTLKFFVGLIVSLIITACPIVFSFASTALYGEGFQSSDVKYVLSIPVLVAVMTYSLCFGCNVLVRNTARSWLIGIFLAGLIMVVPFMLPLGFKDIVSDTETWVLGVYPATILFTSAAAFVLAIFATHRDWHLRTNLKGLLCVATGLAFVLLMLFTSQVANIRVLREKDLGLDDSIALSRWSRLGLDSVGNRVVVQGMYYVDVGKAGISLQKIGTDDTNLVNPPTYGNMGMDPEGRPVTYGPEEGQGYSETTYPDCPSALYLKTQDGTYYFGIVSYFRKEGEERKTKTLFEEVYLRSYKLVGNSWQVADELNISDCLTDRNDYLRTAMRLIDRTLIGCVNNSFVSVDVSSPDELKLIGKKLNAIHGRAAWLGQEDREKEFSIPLIPFDGISQEERIRLSIDLRYRAHYSDNSIYDSSIVAVENGKIAFFYASEREVARFDVIGWDDEEIRCRFSMARPYTILERMAQPYGPNDHTFVRNQRLYVQEYQQLMVFDVSSDRKIRKLGHFYRMDCSIEDVAVLEDGRMILCASWNKPGETTRNERTQSLYLLENHQ